MKVAPAMRIHGLDFYVQPMNGRWYAWTPDTGEVYSSSSRQRALENCISDNINPELN